jgi:hypothetical protein
VPCCALLCPAVPPDSMDKILRLYLGEVPTSLPTRAPVTRDAKRSEATSRPCARFRAAFKRTHPTQAQHAGVLQIDVLCCRRKSECKAARKAKASARASKAKPRCAVALAG